MQNERLHYLYSQYIKAGASEAELQELMSMADDPANEKEFHELMEHSWTELDEIDQRIIEATKAPVFPLHKRTWIKIASAAVVLFAIATTWLSLQQEPQVISPTESTPATESTPTQIKNDVAPGKDGAILTLADGTTIVLDDAANGKLATQSGASITKQDGKIVYDPLTINNSPLTWNTMSTPNGRQYSLVLSDGSKVWLNAASSIKFPATFVGNERRVEITGEAYFEVAHNASMPFHVITKDQDITVLGTHFNVNSYDDEDAIRTTLLEGSVRVTSSNKNSVVLKPGQQSISVPNSPLTIHHSPDVENVLAWKNGLFNFNDADIKEIMKQAARWFDVEVKYQGNISRDKFKGKISRNTNLSQLLKILEINGVKWRIDGKTVIIKNS